MRAARLRITGRVQGVGYRAWVMQMAARHGLRGWVRNRSDGSVEALVIGEEDAVGRIIEACREGPFGARVTDVAVSDAEDDGSFGFMPKPTL
ncbi:MAG: acylphosphatase [Alphaproteobacteria bacterium]|nr:acylphosphatase [Alphaproteobacteria bacterium]